jgi:hypothetical protein
MVGGTVIGLARGPEDTLVHVEERGPYRRKDTSSIRVIERRRDDGSPVEIGVGDSIWWQGRDAMWTPKEARSQSADSGDGRTWDIRLPRVGHSH